MKNVNVTSGKSVVVSQVTQNKNNERKIMDSKYIELKNTVTIFYTIIRRNVKNIQKDNKKAYKQILKNVEKSLSDNIKNEIIKSNNGQNTFSFLGDILGCVFDIKRSLHIDKTNIIDFRTLMKDKNFMIFYKNLYICKELMFNNEKILFIVNAIFDIRSAILAYYLLSERNISEIKILNVLSYFFKNSIITLDEKDRTKENIEKIRMITTGVKYEKERECKNEVDNTIKNKKFKSQKFDLLQHLSTRITIKYITNAEYKHRYHKRPEEHRRSGHYRFYKKTGKQVWIHESVINKGVNNTNELRCAS